MQRLLTTSGQLDTTQDPCAAWPLLSRTTLMWSAIPQSLAPQHCMVSVKSLIIFMLTSKQRRPIHVLHCCFSRSWSLPAHAICLTKRCAGAKQRQSQCSQAQSIFCFALFAVITITATAISVRDAPFGICGRLDSQRAHQALAIHCQLYVS